MTLPLLSSASASAGDSCGTVGRRITTATTGGRTDGAEGRDGAGAGASPTTSLLSSQREQHLTVINYELLKQHHHQHRQQHPSSLSSACLHYRRKYSSTDDIAGQEYDAHNDDDDDDAEDNTNTGLNKNADVVSSLMSPCRATRWSSSIARRKLFRFLVGTSLLIFVVFVVVFFTTTTSESTSSTSKTRTTTTSSSSSSASLLYNVAGGRKKNGDPDGFLRQMLSRSAFGLDAYDLTNLPPNSHHDGDNNYYYYYRPCQPRKIHLSQRSDVFVDDLIEKGGQGGRQGRVNMTVSFTLDHESCGTSGIGSSDRNDVTIVVVYGKQQQQQRQRHAFASAFGRIFDSLSYCFNFYYPQMVVVTDNKKPMTMRSDGDGLNDDDNGDNGDDDPYNEVVSFEFNSPLPSVGHYVSPKIYHVTLANLQSGSKYWYRILVYNNKTNQHQSKRQNRRSETQNRYDDEDDVDRERRVNGHNDGRSSTTSSFQAVVPNPFPHGVSSHEGDDDDDDYDIDSAKATNTETTETTKKRSLLSSSSLSWTWPLLSSLSPSLSPSYMFSLRGSYHCLGQTKVYTFPTPPTPKSSSSQDTGNGNNNNNNKDEHEDDDDDQTTTTLALVGDLGQTENSTKTMYNIMKSDATSLIIAGDLSYSDGNPYRWESWLELMEPLLRSLPMVSIPGNHEIECDDVSHQVFTPYESYFRNPNRLPMKPDRQPPSDEYRKSLWHGSCTTPSEFLGHYNYGNAFTSFRHGLAHIIMMNSYTDVNASSVQYDWLKHTALPSVNRDLTPWVIVVFHVPLYTTFLGHNGEVNSVNMKQSIEDLLFASNVNLVVSGHDHAYMRTKPMYRSKPNQNGPIYLTLGAGGNREQHTKGFIHPDHPEPWVVKRENDEYGYGLLKIRNATHAHLTWRRDHTCSMGDECVHDNVWIENVVSVS